MSSTTRRYAGRMTERTRCFLLRSESPRQVLLGLKKTGFGANKYAGIGGKVEAGKTVTQAAVREVAEEIGVRVQEGDLEEAGHLTFLFPTRPAWSQVAHVFGATAWSGEPVESAEMKPVWFNVQHLPFDQMWQDGPHWLPLIMASKTVRLTFVFAADNETVVEIY